MLDVSADLTGWYPDLQPATERIGLEQRLEHCRSTVVAVAGRLDQVAAAAQPLPATALTIAGIVKHLAWVEDHYFVGKMLGRSLPEPWASAPLSEDPDWPFHSARHDHIGDVVDLYRQACQRGRDIAAGYASLDDLAAVRSFGKAPINLRWLLIHLATETAWHLGHIDLIRDHLHIPTSRGND
jgi:hypothetical protein